MRQRLIKTRVGKKGVVNVLELITVVITLFVSFSIFFPQADYKNRWDDAYMILKARDMILLLERTGSLHTYAFSPDEVRSFFETLFPESSLIVWSETDGGIKSDIKIACDCPSGTIAELAEWVNGLKLNERNITISFCSADLDSPTPCVDDSDALLIWGYKPLEPYEQLLSDYISDGNGVVEVMDFNQPGEVDSVQTGVFGLRWAGEGIGTMDYDEFPRKPRNTADIIFEPYKYFYHVPLPLKTNDTGETIDGCDYIPAKNGTFDFKGTEYGFWICGSNSVWFDTDGDIVNDTLVERGEEVTIGGIYNFSLNYVNSDSSMSVSFKPSYRFDDFLEYASQPGQFAHIEPADYDANRILIRAVELSTAKKYPGVILNKFGETGTAWVANFSEDGFGDDEKMLLISLLLWSSNKQSAGSAVSNIRMGYLTSYVTINNVDMFEVYKFDLGLGSPF